MLIAQECARKQKLAACSRGWLVASSCQTQHTCQASQKVNSHASWSIQDKIVQLAIRLSRDWSSDVCSSDLRVEEFEETLMYRLWVNQSCFSLGFLSQNSLWKLSYNCGKRGIYTRVREECETSGFTKQGWLAA